MSTKGSQAVYAKRTSSEVLLFCYTSGMELFDLVNAQDKVIGVTDKVTAHTNGELHRVAAVFVFDEDGQLYVQIHKKSGGLYDHSVGGHVAQGESYDEAAKRESAEELGIDQPLTHIATFYSDEGVSMQHMFGLYKCTASTDWTFKPNDEVAEIVLLPVKQIKELMTSHPEKFTGGFINTMKRYSEHQASD